MRKVIYTGFLLSVLSFSPLMAATLHGFVREKDSREPVILANVWIKGTQTGTTTNLKGYYVLSGLPAGTYDLCFRFMGFKMETVSKKLAPDDDIIGIGALFCCLLLHVFRYWRIIKRYCL